MLNSYRKSFLHRVRDCERESVRHVFENKKNKTKKNLE